MAKKIVVEQDKVSGTDTHAVTGVSLPPPATPPPYSGKGKYTYDGAMTSGLSDFVKIGDKKVALVTSGSTLTSPHVAASANSFDPATVDTTKPIAFANPPDGKGKPSEGAGSKFVKVGNDAVLLDEDGLDTCGGERGQGNSTVAASKQDFVQVSA